MTAPVPVSDILEALNKIADYSEPAFDHPAEEWAKHTPKTCAECKRWRELKHPLQHSCDGWYRLLYSRESIRKDQERALGFTLQRIAREALLRAPKATVHVSDILEVLQEVSEYCDQRADVNWEGTGPGPAMSLGSQVDCLIARLEAQARS